MTKIGIGEINRLLRQPHGGEQNSDVITVVAKDFLRAYRDPTAPLTHQHAQAVDDLRAILATLGSASMRKSPVLLLLVKVLKVLLRKDVNRAALGQEGVRIITELMSAVCADVVISECANVVLNMCYDSRNVKYFLEADGLAALTPLINSRDEQLKASGLGALQSVCFDKPGRDATRDSGMIAEVVRSLGDASSKVRARALGTVHNLSTDARSIRAIREEGALPVLIRLLRSHETQTCGSAAGTIQNLSREERSRAMLASFGAVEPLADLLVGHHVKSQISAAGALVNIFGQDVEGDRRQLLLAALADGIVLGVIESCLA